MLPYQERYEYRGSEPVFVRKDRQDILNDPRDIACEVNLSAGTPWQALVQYQRRMNEYMSNYGIVFYQP